MARAHISHCHVLGPQQYFLVLSGEQIIPLPQRHDKHLDERECRSHDGELSVGQSFKEWIHLGAITRMSLDEVD